MKDFIKSAEEIEQDEAEIQANLVTFEHWGVEVTFRKPAEGQEMMMLALGGREMDAKAAAQFINMFLNLATEDDGTGDEEKGTRGFNTRRHFELLMEEGRFSLAKSGGVFDIWDGLMEHWSGKGSKKPSASRASASRTGASSTGTTRRRASTSSRSRSTAG